MAVKCSNRTLWTTADEDGYPYWVEFEDRPFTKGNSKFMYKGRLNGKGPRSGDYCTLKVFKTIDIAQHEDWSLYVSRAERASKLATEFNKMLDNQYKVTFLVPVVALIDISSTCSDCIYFLSNTKRIRPDDCVAVEPYLGKFRKFYRNSPLKGAEYAYILQAFSHFTASQTGDTLICGLQGTARGTEFILTNPIIHSSNQEWGPKDQGAEGFRKFFSNHTCNHICQTMDLPEYLETMSVAEEIDQGVVEGETSKQSLEPPVVSEVDTSPKHLISVSTGQLDQEVTHPDAESLPQAEAQTADTSEDIKETPAILQTPPMSRVGRTIVAPVSMGISVSRSSSVTGPPVFAEDLPSESISRPLDESVILDAIPIDDIAPQLSDSQEVLPPPSSEYWGPYTPCRTVNEYLELKKHYASFSPGSETIPMIDDELACAESEIREVLPPPTDDFEPTISPSLNTYLKDKESLEIIPHGSMDLDLEYQQSISVFEDHVPAPDLDSMNNFQMTPSERISHDTEMLESLVSIPCGTMSQESLVTTPRDSQPCIVSTPKDSVSQDLIPVSEPPLEAGFHLDLQESTESPQDIESRVCFVSIPPDCMDHHLDTLESLEALSPASERLRSVEVIAEPKWSSEESSEEYVESGADHDVEEQISAPEFSETQTIQETSTEGFETLPLDNVEVEVQKSVCADTMSSDFKQSLETIPEGSTESDSAHSLENEKPAPEVSTVVEAEKVTDDVAAVENIDGTIVDSQPVETTDASFSGQEKTVVETTSEIQSGPAIETTPEAVVTEETVVESTSENVGSEGVIVEPATEALAEGGATVCQETAIETSVEPVGEATVSQETSVETVGEAAVSQETTVETTAEPVGETAVSQETPVETAGEAAVSQETTVETTAEPVSEAAVSQETTVETTAKPVGEAEVSQETTVEPVGETTAEPVGEATVSQETTVETSVEPVGEAMVSQETTAKPVGEATVSQETTVETSVEPVGEAMVSQETTAKPVGEATVSQETTVETSVEPVGEAAVDQETAVETRMGSYINQEPAIETSAETTVDTTGECYVSQEITEPTAQEAYVSQETAMGEANVCQQTAVESTGEAYVSQDTVVESTNETPGEGYVSHDNVVESSAETTGESYINQETAGTTEGYASQDAAVESVVETTGEVYVYQDTGSGSTAEVAGETYVYQETTGGSAVEATGECNICQDSGLGSTIGTIEEGYVCQDSAVETTVESSNVVETTEEGGVHQDAEFGPTGEGYMSQSTEFESNVEPTADGYTSQDSGFGSVVDTNPTGYSNQDQSFAVTYDSDPGSNTYSQSFEPVTSSYPAEANNAMSSQVSDPYYYGVPPEYRISENCQPSQCEASCPQRYTKMTIVPDLDSMEHVETKCLEGVCEEHDIQQGIETLPRRKVSYYLEPQESHEIITFRINISPEIAIPDQKPDECVYQNVGTARQCSKPGEPSLGSSNCCNTCRSRETSENVRQTSGQDSERAPSFYSYHYSGTNDGMESMPQRSCGYSSDVHQNIPSGWSPTHSIWDHSQCSTAQNQQTTPGEKVDSKFDPSV